MTSSRQSSVMVDSRDEALILEKRRLGAGPAGLDGARMGSVRQDALFGFG